MDNRRSYEMLLTAQYQNHERMMYFLTQIRFYDDMLLHESKKQEPDASAIEYVTIQKDRLVKKMDKLTLEIQKTQLLINESVPMFLDGLTHPLYQKLITIHQLVSDAFRDLLSAEDENNPDVLKNLTIYKERLELDEQIKKVPPEKRQVFFVRL